MQEWNYLFQYNLNIYDTGSEMELLVLNIMQLHRNYFDSHSVHYMNNNVKGTPELTYLGIVKFELFVCLLEYKS